MVSYLLGHGTFVLIDYLKHYRVRQILVPRFSVAATGFLIEAVDQSHLT